MEGLYFEVKSIRSSFDHSPSMSSGSTCGDMMDEAVEVEEVQYKLTLIGSLPVHRMTTMAMLPWVVADISRSQEPGPSVSLCVSPSWVRCVCVRADGLLWDPLTHTVLFECRPHQVTKLIHNSQEPSSFGCLLRDAPRCACYVFKCQDSTKVPEIISTLRQAGKSSARNDDTLTIPNKPLADPGDTKPLETQITFSSLPTAGSVANSLALSPAAFAKKFEVLFCGRVTVAHKKAPPALIDECIEKFSQLAQSSGTTKRAVNAAGGLVGGLKRALAFQSNGQGSPTFGNGATGSPTNGKRPLLFKRDPSFPSLQALDENGLSPEISHANTTDALTLSPGVQPTSLRENRTMLFMVGRSQIFLVSPDTKKVAIEKSFREISFCSQGIRHVDHFGFICRETVERGSCHFVCYIFQCTDESLVDEIMLTLKQAFSVAAVQQNAKSQSQQCDSCPMLQLHKLCERIEGLNASKTKLELQRHMATLDNQDQAAVFESTMRSRPKSEQEENELTMASLRNLYEERQRIHHHILPKDTKLNEEEKAAAAPPVEAQQQSSSRQRLEQFKSRAKRSLTESLEGIWKGSNKAVAQRGNSERSHSVSSISTVNSQDQTGSDGPLANTSQLRPTSPLRCHNSTGDLKQLDPFASPSSSHSSSRPADGQPQGFRRRASTFSHPPTPSSADDSPARTLTYTPQQDPAAASKPKLLRHYSVSTDTPHQSKDVAAFYVSSADCEVGESPLRSHRHSWRQQIFLRVATPQKNTDVNDRGDSLDGGRSCVDQGICAGSVDLPKKALPEARTRRSKEELRELWRTAILQQILLQRMERENQKLQASESDLQNKRLKLDYEEITPCLKEVTLVWEKMLGTPGKAKVKFDHETIHLSVAQGVPKQHRGEIWKFLSEQYLLKQTVPSRPPTNDTPYKELLKQLTTQQHAILIDLGRTFPTHPYFQAQLGAGQLSLYNILKAYSLLDPEVGYCQGLSFIAGVLLLHMGEEDAFNMLKFLMYDVGLRKQYRPDMIILQIQMYQLSRLLHDYHRDLYSHLEEQEIGPSLYATPWFLTAFASHFPLGFVARVFDMLFLQGPEVIFKVALSLLGSHKPLILQHDSLESIVDFIKTTLPKLGLVQMEKTINQVCEMDLSKQLQAYDVEYHVLQDELLDTPPTLNQHQRAAQLERTNQSLRQQNLDLLEELQVSYARVCNLESRLAALAQSESKLKEQVSSLELEKQHLASTATRLHKLLTSLGIPTTADGHGLPPADVEFHAAQVAALGTQAGQDDRTLESSHQHVPLVEKVVNGQGET
ncbi:TBC1 domain family member 1 isoform X3 [Vanacampus margaritifer]